MALGYRIEGLDDNQTEFVMSRACCERGSAVQVENRVHRDGNDVGQE